MQKEEFITLLQQPNSANNNQVNQLSESIEKFPYFQALHALQLKGLKQKKSYKYNNALKISAAYTTDRSVLFDYITSDVFNQNDISQHVKQNAEYIKSITVEGLDDISVNRSITIDDALKTHIKNTKGVLDPNLFEAKHKPKLQEPIIHIDVKNISPEEKLGIGKPLEFNKEESYSFTEWLKITSFTPINRAIKDKSSVSKKAPLENKLTIINRFISENPKIKPVTNTVKPKLVSIENDISDGLMTETLARIYLEQKNYDKAIQSYKILSLKYPEKSSFFADQIKAIKQLKAQNNI